MAGALQVCGFLNAFTVRIMEMCESPCGALHLLVTCRAIVQIGPTLYKAVGGFDVSDDRHWDPDAVVYIMNIPLPLFSSYACSALSYTALVLRDYTRHEIDSETGH